MKTTVDRVELATERPFGISRGTVETTENAIVRVEHDGAVGLGGAAPSPYYGETPATVASALPALLDCVERIDDPHAIQRVARAMADVVEGNYAAKAAVDIALHDLAATVLDLPLYRYLGLDPSQPITSSFTIALTEPDRMGEGAAAAVAAGFDVLKVKLGGADDAAAIEAVRSAAPDATIRVDANGAWTPQTAVERCERCLAHDVELVEQPVPADDHAGLRYVSERTAVPIAADESCVTATDVPAIANAADVAVVKLMKCGGVGPAIRTIHAARACGLDVMLGCMLETNVSIAAAAHLIPLADYADLDGSILLADDPYRGVPMPGGAVDLRTVEVPGTGASDGPHG